MHKSFGTVRPAVKAVRKARKVVKGAGTRSPKRAENFVIDIFPCFLSLPLVSCSYNGC